MLEQGHGAFDSKRHFPGASAAAKKPSGKTESARAPDALINELSEQEDKVFGEQVWAGICEIGMGEE